MPAIRMSNVMGSGKEGTRMSRSSNESPYPAVYRTGTGSNFWQRGHLTTLRVARCLYNGFGLSCQQVFECLRVYNSRLADKWTDRELLHKAQSAASGTYDKPSGWMLPATDATAPSYSQSSFTRARTHARACQESEISVASVPKSGRRSA